MAKSDPNGGIRSQTRHNVENVGVGGFALVALNRMVEADWISPTEANWLFAASMIVGSGLLKMASEKKIVDRLMTKVGLGSIVVLMSLGCANNFGSVIPHEFKGPDGETIVFCEMHGWQAAWGGGDVCRNVAGDHVSEVFAVLWQGTVGAALNLVGSFFGRPPVSPFPAEVAPHSHQAPIVIEPSETDTSAPNLFE